MRPIHRPGLLPTTNKSAPPTPTPATWRIWPKWASGSAWVKPCLGLNSPAKRFVSFAAGIKSAGFNGPIMVEGVKVSATAEGTTANAKANREFLERVLEPV